MTIRWQRILPILLPIALLVVVFSVYAYAQPTTRCVIVNESLQTTVKASGQRCMELLPEEEAVVFTPDGTYVVSDDLVE